MGSKIWRLIFNFLLSAMLAVFGWNAVLAFLNWAAQDPQLKVYFAAAQGDEWLGILYRTTFIAVGGIFGFALGATIFRRLELVGDRLRGMATRDKVALVGGLVVGLLLAAILAIPIILFLTQYSPAIAVTVAMLLGVAVMYLTTVAALSMKEEIRFYMPASPEEDAPPTEKFKLLDTNVIIDGRIADVARAGFVEPPIYVPGFILDELQHIADSSDDMRRARGRHGLEVLNTMNKELDLTVREYDRLAPRVPGEEVDARLVRLAKALNGSIVTNDYNLNRVARLQDVPVLNVNDLAVALRPRVLPGEPMQVKLVKEGKEPTQGIGYLDDGTMVVVENGRRQIGETVEVIVSQVIQTASGKIIFAHLQEGGAGSSEENTGGDDLEGGVRAYTRSGPRRPVRR
ncbi:MAG: TRAM domain-containing protein [Cytophagales bacterium]|nr:TRAM domain-containing protein [Armatimonadota bacterium]